MFAFLAMFGGYKTHALVVTSIVAQAVKYFKPELASQCDMVSAGALSLTPTTIRMGVQAATNQIMAAIPSKSGK